METLDLVERDGTISVCYRYISIIEYAELMPTCVVMEDNIRFLTMSL